MIDPLVELALRVMDEHLYPVLLTKAEIEYLLGCIGVANSEYGTNELTDVVIEKLEAALATT